VAGGDTKGKTSTKKVGERRIKIITQRPQDDLEEKDGRSKKASYVVQDERGVGEE